MTQMTITDRLGSLDQYKYNPGLMQRASLDVLDKVMDGTINIVDPTNPFVFSLETSAVHTALSIQHSETLTRRQYAAAATTPEDLYLHMSDKDYVGRFALPSKTKFTFLFRQIELLESLIEDPLTGFKKITIPRNTHFKVADTIFSIQYPIDIRKLQHGGLQLVYNTEQLSPLQTLSTNIIPFEEKIDNENTKYIQFEIDVSQFNIVYKYNDVNTAAGFTTKVEISDSFYYARVYMLNSFGKWNEILTTHTSQIYDPKVPTALIRVYDKIVDISIPSVYTLSGLVSGKLRIDVYETKGQIDLSLGNYGLDSFSATYLSIDENEDTEYTAAINNIKTAYAYSIDRTSGGRAALSFDELRTRVINNSIGIHQLPITGVELQNSITDAGYEFEKNIDTITNRVFLASKQMPDPIDDKLISPAASNMSRVNLNGVEASLAYGVNMSGNRTILTPDVLFKNVNGITKLVSKLDYNQLVGLNAFQKCEELNNNNYLYTPFHYVLDSTTHTFGVRPYYLDNPSITARNFIAENSKSGIQVGMSGQYTITKSPNGYTLSLVTKSNDAFKELLDINTFCQISFIANGQNQYSYLTGVQRPRQDSDERVYDFIMESDFDIDTAHKLSQKSFRFSTAPLSTYCDLIQDFNVFFITNDTSVNNSTPIAANDLLGKFQLPDSSIALSHEKLKVNFGCFLDTLWSRAKSVVSATQYLKYLEDVPAVYTEDIYDIDPLTGSSITINANGTLDYNILHQKDSPILDSNGLAVYKHRRGDVVLDAQGNPIPDSSINNTLTRYIDILTIEGVYRFATDKTSTTYKKLLNESLVSWITNDVVGFNSNLLDQSKVFFYPKITNGDVKCLIGDNLSITIPITQSFTVTLNVPEETYKDYTLRAEIDKVTLSIINNEIKNSNTIAISAIQSKLREKYGKDVYDVEVKGLGPNQDYKILTIQGKSSKMSIKKKIIMLPDNSLILEEDITINYIKHA